MDAATARAVLGVGPAASGGELRAAYRARLRATHPDLRGGGDAGTADVVAAYRLLRDAPPEPASEPPAPPAAPAEAGVAVVVDGDTVVADLPAGDLFALLVEAGHALGEVAYVDPHAGLLEIVVDVAGHGACSVVLSLQGRSVGHGGPGGGDGACTEAFCTVEPLGGGPAPPADVVADLLAEGLLAVTRQ